MATFKKFEDIKAWQKARLLPTKIYSITSADAFHRTTVFVRALPKFMDCLRKSEE